MKNIFKDSLTIEPCDLYLAMIYFLEEYNKDFNSQDINNLLSELEQFHITQWGFKEWQNVLKTTLIESGSIPDTDTEMHDMSTSLRWQSK